MGFKILEGKSGNFGTSNLIIASTFMYISSPITVLVYNKLSILINRLK